MKTEAIKSLCSASRMLSGAVAECARNAESAVDVERVMELDRIATELTECLCGIAEDGAYKKPPDIKVNANQLI